MTVESKTEQIIRRPTLADIDFIVDNVREEDVIEVQMSGGGTIRECLDQTPDIDKNAWVWEYDGKVLCIFGVNPFEDKEGVGVIWMLATKDFERKSMIFASACKSVLEELIKPFNYILNYVYAENRKSVKWLKWLGFTVREAEPIGIDGARFHRFEMWNESCVIQ